jgi:DNA-binding CsgD family transcriptional regulator
VLPLAPGPVTADTGPMRLLDRESPLAALTEYAGQARQGHGRLVLVAGEAGVGKSALVESFAAGLADARWSWGACDGLFIPRPLGPLFDLAGQLGGELLERCQAGAPREQLFGALLRQIDQPGTLNVLVVEDIHWADEATVDLLRFLGRRLRDLAVLVIVTYRDDGQPSGPLRLALGDLATLRPARRISLGPLSPDAVGVLAADSGLEPGELFRLTGGNPFYVTEVVQAGVSDVPASARDAVLARAARLGPQARSVLDAAALLGTRSELGLVGSVTACPAPALDEVLASGLLTGDGTWLRFRHEIARLAVAQAIASHRRVAAHARILAALRAAGSSDQARMAFHAEGAGDGAAVLSYATAAARQAAGLASHREAAAQFERALASTTGADPAAVAGLQDELARELSLIDRWPDAAEAGQRALAGWQALGHPRREGATLHQLSHALARLCRGPEAIAAARAAVRILEPLGPDAQLASAHAQLAHLVNVSGDQVAAIGLARRARAIAEPLAGRAAQEVLSNALNTEACAAASLDQDWTPLMSRALDIALQAGLEEQAGRAYANMCSMYVGQRRFAEAEPYLADGIAYCDEHDVGTFANCVRGARAGALEQTGRWDEAVALSQELLVRCADSPVNRIFPLQALGVIRARRGEQDPWPLLDEALADAEGSGDPQLMILVRLARIEAHWLAGQSGRARREAETAHAASLAGCDSWERGPLAVWLRRTGSPADPGRGLAPPCQLLLDGHAEQAAQAWAELGCRYEAALALLDATGDAALRQAISILTELGASAAVRLARQRMRALGLRSIPSGPQSAAREHPFGLTRREQEVLELICERQTNAQIAGRLFITAKTVDHHVSAVLAKLGASTRREAAARARHVQRPDAPARRDRPA